MSETQTQSFLEPTQDSGRAFLMRDIVGPLVMLNLLRFREHADYSQHPDLAPVAAISGRAAYQLYYDHTLPFLQKAGGEVIYTGDGGHFLIGPADVRWDLAMLVRHRSVDDFMAFASNEAYMGGMGHRLAAIEDSRLLPLTE